MGLACVLAIVAMVGYLFGFLIGFKLGGRSARKSQYAVAATGLAGLSWLAAGSTPEAGPYASNIRRAIDFTIRHPSKRTRSKQCPRSSARIRASHS